MRSNKKHFSPGWILGISLGLASSGAVYAAGPIADTFTAGGTLTATQMNNIKNAVNDLQGNVPSTSCRTNAGAVDAGATRVGPLCVDEVPQAAGSTWSAAVDFCRAAGKRLMTPGEYMAAKNQDAAGFGMTNGVLEWVDSTFSDGTLGGGTAGRMTVGYMGPDDGTNITVGDIFYATNASYDVTAETFIFYRCAR